MSNFLGDVHVARKPTSILSTSELMEREGIRPEKSMNFRDKGEALSVFLVLAKDGVFKDAWDAKRQVYSFDGHDSTTKETGGKSLDQLLMYGGDKLTENGKFFKAANAFKDGMRAEPLQIQVYEKLDPGVWFDKDIFYLVDAKSVMQEGRKVFKFYLEPSDRERTDRKPQDERMLPARIKSEVWAREKGRCMTCGIESGLRFVGSGDVTTIKLLCAKDRGETSGWGLLG